MDDIKTLKKLFLNNFDYKDIKKIIVNTKNDFFDTQDNNYNFINHFDTMNNYYGIHLKNNIVIYIGDYTSIDIDYIDNNININKYNQLFDYIELLEDSEYSIKELNNFIKDIYINKFNQ